MIKISKYYLVRNLTNDSNEIWGYQEVQSLLDVLGVTLNQLGRRFGHFISIDGEFNNLNGDAVEVTTDPTSMYVKLLQTGSQFGVWRRQLSPNIDDYTVVLLHFDNQDEPWQNEGSVSITIKPVAVEGSSRYFGKDYGKFGIGIYALAAVWRASSLSLGGQDFTVDFWLRWISSSDFGRAFTMLFGLGTNSYTQLSFRYENPSSLVWLGGSSSDWQSYEVLPNDLQTTQMNHYAFVYQHDLRTCTFYINGVAKGSRVAEIPRQALYSGNFGGSSSTYYSQVYVDEFRVSDGIARWTSDFTPPTAPYGV